MCDSHSQKGLEHQLKRICWLFTATDIKYSIYNMGDNKFVEEVFGLWMSILMGSACSLAVILNIIVIICIVSSPARRIKKNTFVTNLALSDIMSSLILLNFLFLDANQHFAPIFNSLLVASVLNILAVSVDCSIAIKWAPLKYDFIVTAPRCFLACVFIWIVSFSIYLPPRFVLHTDLYYLVSYVSSPIFILALLFITTANYSAVFRQISSFDLTAFDRKQTRLRKKQNRDILATFALILGSSFICWLPMCVCLLIEYFESDLPEYFNAYISSLSFSLVSVNLALDPAIFIWRLWRRQNIWILSACFKRSTNPSNSRAVATVAGNVPSSTVNT